MKLVLELLGPPRLMGARRHFELRMGSLLIGRSPEADWVIPDSERMISRLHLRIDSAHGGFMLTDTSVNGVYVNDGVAPVGFGTSLELRDGDRVQIGDAQIAVTVEDGVRPPATVDPLDLDADAFRPPSTPASARDPLGGPFGAVAPLPEAPTAGALGSDPAQPGTVDANWMIEPVGPPSTSSRAGREGPSASLPGAPPVHHGPPDGRPDVLDLVDARPDLSARALAAAVEVAARALDPTTRSAFLAGLAALLESGR